MPMLAVRRRHRPRAQRSSWRSVRISDTLEAWDVLSTHAPALPGAIPARQARGGTGAGSVQARGDGPALVHGQRPHAPVGRRQHDRQVHRLRLRSRGDRRVGRARARRARRAGGREGLWRHPRQSRRHLDPHGPGRDATAPITRSAVSSSPLPGLSQPSSARNVARRPPGCRRGAAVWSAPPARRRCQPPP